MWIADKWEDYELLDCGGGEKLERWGRQILVRPDPQAIWETPHANRGWKNAQGRSACSIFSRAKSQFTACSGKSPVCLKFMGLHWNVRSR